jgi:hypothetical protein
MPSAPILTRTLLWERLGDGSIHVLDWNLVNTSLGLMVEPRVMLRESGAIKDEDLAESGYSDMTVLQSDNFFATYGFAGSQWPHYRANDPGVQ